MIGIADRIRRALIIGLMLAFAGGTTLVGCSSSEEAETPPPEETEETGADGYCAEGDPNYPDCLDVNM